MFDKIQPSDLCIIIPILQVRKLKQYFISWKSNNKVPTVEYIPIQEESRRRDYPDPLDGLGEVTSAMNEAHFS